MNAKTEMGEGMSGGMKNSRGLHWLCCILPILSWLMWIAAVVFLILSWISVTNTTGEIWGFGPQWYIWNVVMFALLALYGGCKKIGSCRGKSGCCCKDGVCMPHGSGK